MKKLVLFSSFLLLSLFLVNCAEARSGCCSHHDGVCGCGCCDGTPLSATCAPYYPSCNNEPADEPQANTVEKNNDEPVYSAAAVINSVNANDQGTISPVVESKQVNKTEAKVVAPLIDEPKQDVVNKTDNKAEPISSAPVPVNESKTTESDASGFWVGFVFGGLVVYIIYLVKKKKNKNN